MPSPPSKKNKYLLKNLWGYPLAEVRPRPRNGCISFLKNIFFFKFLIWPTGLPRRRSLQKITARWRYRLPSNNLTAHYNSQFFASFQFGFDQEAQRPKRFWIGPKHDSVHFKSLCGFLPIDRWSCVHPVYARQDCNGNPISTFLPIYEFQMNWPLGRFSL